MKKIRIPENTRVIIEDGVILFEATSSKKLEVGKWYKYKNHIALILDGDLNICGFDDGIWYENDNSNDTSLSDHYPWRPVDMVEVEKLLIGEAERRYKNIMPNKDLNMGNSFFIEEDSLESNGYKTNLTVFDFKTGKWAEVIKEPIYTNSYGTVLKNGDKFSWVHGISLRIVKNDIFDKNCKINFSCLFMGTIRECHQYIADNWDELNKNK